MILCENYPWENYPCLQFRGQFSQRDSASVSGKEMMHLLLVNPGSSVGTCHVDKSVCLFINYGPRKQTDNCRVEARRHVLGE